MMSGSDSDGDKVNINNNTNSNEDIVDSDTQMLMGMTGGNEDSTQSAEQGGFLSGAVDKAGRVREFFGGDKREAKYNPNDYPEFGSVVNDMSPLDPMKIPTKLALSTTFDPKVEQQIIQKQFPDAKFTDVGDGYMQIDYMDKEDKPQKAVLNKAGLTGSDLESIIGTILPFGKTFNVVDKLAKSRGPAMTMLSQLFGQGGTEAVLQGGQMLLGREELNLPEISIAGAGGPLGEVINMGSKRLAANRAFSQGGDDVPYTTDIKKRVDEADEATRETGIPLYKGQKTTSRADLTKQEYALGQEEVASTVETAINKQNEASLDAVDNLLNKLAPSTAVETGEAGVRKASQDIIKRARNNRKLQASPLYNQAKKEDADVDVTPLLDAFDTLFADMPNTGKGFRDIAEVKDLISGSMKEGSEQGSFKKLLRAKKTIDSKLDAFGEGALDVQSKDDVLDISNALEDQLLAASPTYQRAKEAYRVGTPEVERLEESLIGSFAKYTDDDLYKVSQKIFGKNQNLTNTEQVKKVKNDILSAEGGKDAWNSILRVNFERSINSAVETTSENTPASLHKAIFGNTPGSKENIMEAAKGTPIAKNLKWLDIALKRAGKGRKLGSPTSRNESIKAKLSSWLKPFLDTAKSVSLDIMTSGIASAKGATGAAGQNTYSTNLQFMADLIFDPKWTTEMDSLRKLNSNSKEAENLIKSYLKKAGRAINKAPNKALSAYQLKTKSDNE